MPTNLVYLSDQKNRKFIDKLFAKKFINNFLRILREIYASKTMICENFCQNNTNSPLLIRYIEIASLRVCSKWSHNVNILSWAYSFQKKKMIKLLQNKYFLTICLIKKPWLIDSENIALFNMYVYVPRCKLIHNRFNNKKEEKKSHYWITLIKIDWMNDSTKELNTCWGVKLVGTVFV